MTKKILTVAVLALAFGAGAATKTVIFTAPAAVTERGGWQVCMLSDKGPFEAPTTLVGRTRVCAYGDDGVSTSCSEHEERTSTPPQAYIDFLNQRLAAWKTAKGY
jgi:hypothetical protein